VLCALPSGQAQAWIPPGYGVDQSRGEMLYTTHCVACHTTRMHWREKRLATDWSGLLTQVRRWQELSGLGWTADDIGEVARFLDARYHHFEAAR